jgi:rhodanese-related sulfurtransferase/DNA-binding transcriptional ArsR family regulator
MIIGIVEEDAVTGERAAKDVLYEQLARVGRALASPKRLELLDLLAQGERSVDALAGQTAMGITNTSAHLQALRAARLVTSRRQGTRVLYRLTDDHVAAFLGRLRDLAHDTIPEVRLAARAYLGDEDDPEPVTRAELLRRMENGEVLVLDVRPDAEYDAGHIPGAVMVPPDQLDDVLPALPSDRAIVAYCRGPYCVYAAQAVRFLRARGIPARRLEDGLPEWRLAGLPVTAAAGA